MIKNNLYLTILISLMMFNAAFAFAQIDIRLTSAYGRMALKPNSSLNISAGAENFFTIGLQADYYISRNFGIGIGSDYYIQDTKFGIKLSNYTHSYNGIDRWEADPVPREYEFTIKSNAPDIFEQNTLSFIDFPVSAIYSFPLIKNIYMATRFGLKMGWFLDNNYILQESDLFTRLYFEEWDLELFNIPAHGLYDSRTDWHPEGEMKLNPAISLFSEIGLDFPISLIKIRVSGYFSHTLNNIIDEKQNSLIYWREDYNYVLSLANHVSLMQYGVKLGIGVMNRKEKSIKYSNKIIKRRNKFRCNDVWIW